MAGMAVLFSADHSKACPFCAKLGKTLSDNIAEADLAIYGELQPAERGIDTTELAIRVALKRGPVPADATSVSLARSIPVDESRRTRLVLAHVIDGQIEPYRAIALPREDVVRYLRDAVSLAKRPANERLTFFYGKLGDTEPMIADDAYAEFAKASYADVRAAKSAFRPSQLLGWINDPATPGQKVGLFGLLLGLSGGPDEAKALAKLSTTRDSRLLPGLDGMLAGYYLLEPRRGLEKTMDLLSDKSSDFARRYAAIQTTRFLLAEVPNVDKPRIVRGLADAVNVPEIADLAIDELRKLKAWEQSSRVLALAAANGPTRGSVIRYALACPEPAARSLVDRLRRDDPQSLVDAQQALDFERDIEQQLAGVKKERPRKVSRP